MTLGELISILDARSCSAVTQRVSGPDYVWMHDIEVRQNDSITGERRTTVVIEVDRDARGWRVRLRLEPLRLVICAYRSDLSQPAFAMVGNMMDVLHSVGVNMPRVGRVSSAEDTTP